jgi:hypothetical protein
MTRMVEKSFTDPTGKLPLTNRWTRGERREYRVASARSDFAGMCRILELHMTPRQIDRVAKDTDELLELFGLKTSQKEIP